MARTSSSTKREKEEINDAMIALSLENHDVCVSCSYRNLVPAFILLFLFSLLLLLLLLLLFQVDPIF